MVFFINIERKQVIETNHKEVVVQTRCSLCMIADPRPTPSAGDERVTTSMCAAVRVRVCCTKTQTTATLRLSAVFTQLDS